MKHPSPLNSVHCSPRVYIERKNVSRLCIPVSNRSSIVDTLIPPWTNRPVTPIRAVRSVETINLNKKSISRERRNSHCSRTLARKGIVKRSGYREPPRALLMTRNRARATNVSRSLIETSNQNESYRWFPGHDEDVTRTPRDRVQGERERPRHSSISPEDNNSSSLKGFREGPHVLAIGLSIVRVSRRS